MNNNQTGLRQKILVAKSEEEIVNLLREGDGYDMASDSTRNAWKSASKRRSAQLKGLKYEAPKPVEEEVELPKKKVKRGVKKKKNVE